MPKRHRAFLFAIEQMKRNVVIIEERETIKSLRKLRLCHHGIVNGFVNESKEDNTELHQFLVGAIEDTLVPKAVIEKKRNRWTDVFWIMVALCVLCISIYTWFKDKPRRSILGTSKKP